MKRWWVMSVVALLIGAGAIIARAQTATSEPTCPNAPPTRLIVHERARVATADPRPVNLRVAPGTQNERLAQIPPNEIFYVLEGPTCSERYAWYRIDYDGTSGWIAEGDTTSYYVEVYPPGL